MVVQAKLYTVEEYLALCQQPENADRRLELVEGGDCRAGSVEQEKHCDRGTIAHYLNAYVIPTDIGYISGADGGYQLGPRSVRLPDAAFIPTERARAARLHPAAG